MNRKEIYSKRQSARSKPLLKGLLGFVLIGLLSSCGGGDFEILRPDTILFNGKILTVDEDFSIAEAVAIKDGRFVAVGSSSQVRGLAGDRTEMVDLEGRTVLPDSMIPMNTLLTAWDLWRTN